MKKYCETHHLFYSSHQCPMCMMESSEQIAKKYNLTNIPNKDKEIAAEKEERKEKPKPVTPEMLQSLADKFGSTVKKRK